MIKRYWQEDCLSILRKVFLGRTVVGVESECNTENEVVFILDDGRRVRITPSNGPFLGYDFTPDEDLMDDAKDNKPTV